MFVRFLRDRRGNIAILSAVMITSLVGVSGLVVEYGNGLLNRMQDQRAADVAAFGGATVYSATSSTSAMNAAVANIASLNGLASGSAVSSLVASPSGDGNQAVEVTVSTSVPLVLARVLQSKISLPVTVNAYAELKPGGTGCILALDPTAHQAITFSGSANVDAPHCDVVANSDNSDALDISGSAQLTTPCTVTVGGVNVGSGLHLNSCTSPTTDAKATPDPYASLATPDPATLGSCKSVPNPPGTLPYGYYCNGLSISGTAKFSPGLYYVNGNLAIQGGASVTGSGVTFYVTKKGTTAISGSATATLSAPTTGIYAGILFFGDRAGSTSNNNNISGSSSSTLTGVLYYPTQQVSYTGGSSSPSNCTELIGDKITFSGAT